MLGTILRNVYLYTIYTDIAQQGWYSDTSMQQGQSFHDSSLALEFALLVIVPHCKREALFIGNVIKSKCHLLEFCC